MTPANDPAGHKQKREKPFDIDREIPTPHGGERITIRKEHEQGKVILRKDSMGWVVDVDYGNGNSETFGISESDFKALGGQDDPRIGG